MIPHSTQSCFCLAAGLFLLLAASSAGGQQPPVPSPPPEAPLPAPAAADGRPPERLPAPPAGAGVATEDGPLTLENVRSLAVSNNPSLANVAARIRAARWNALQQGLPPNPIVSYQGNEIGLEGTAGQQGAGVSQQFVTGKKLQIAREAAQRQVLVEQQRFAAQRQRVLTDVSIAFYQVLILQRRIQLVEGLVATTGRAVEAADRLFKAAESRKTDLLQARVELQNARLDLVRTRSRHAAAWRELAAVAGVPDMPQRELVGETEPDADMLAWPEVVQSVLNAHPQISQALAQVNQATWSVRSAEVQPIPNITTSLSWQYDDGAQDDFVGVQVALPLPLWNRNQGGIGTARAQLTAAQRNVQVVELRLRQQLAQEYQQYQVAYEWSRQYQQQILPLAQETLELVSKGYEQGEIGYLDLLTAQRTYVRSNLEYLDALGQLWSSRQRIEGLLLSNSLQAGN